MTDPRLLVEAFIADHHRWEVDAYARHRPRMREAEVIAIGELAAAEYRALLARYCPPGFVSENGGSYGNIPEHDPTTERVVSCRPRGDRCPARTTRVHPLFGPGVFEYRLVRVHGRWCLTSLRAVIDGDQFECL